MFDDPTKYRWVETMAYSPDHSLLAVGSHDQMIYICNTASYEKKIKKMSGHSGALLGLDWSINGDWIRSSDGAHELLFWNPSEKKPRNPKGPSLTKSVTWKDHNCRRGWLVDGVVPKGADGTHINSITMDKDQ